MNELLKPDWSIAAVYRMLRHGKWSCGWWSRREYPTGSMWGFVEVYYDGWHHGLRLGRFGVSVYWFG